MRLDSVLTQAASGLDSVSRRLATVSQNVANVNTPGYSRETLPTSSLVAGGQGYGVRSGVATRVVDTALQANLFSAGAEVAGGQARQTALSAIDAASGAPGSGQDLASQLGVLRDAFSTLANDPSNQTQQRRVVNQADSLARGLNALGGSITTARQAAQDDLVASVTQANDALRAVGKLSDQVIAARSRGESTAGLEDQRDQAIKAVGELAGARFLPQANGDVLAVSGGTILPLRSETGPLSIDAATLAPGTPAGVTPRLLINGQPAQIGGGRIGAQLDLRDNVLPGLQTDLDGFTQRLAAGFAGLGLPLFTDASGVIPPATNAGFTQTIQVNPAVSANPRLVRDGSAPAGAAGSTAVIDRVLDTVLATGPGTLASQASGLVANHASLAASAGRQLDGDQAVQSSLQIKLQASSGVTVDTELAEMVRLQNSYAANAKVISAVQAMWNQLLDSVR